MRDEFGAPVPELLEIVRQPLREEILARHAAERAAFAFGEDACRLGGIELAVARVDDASRRYRVAGVAEAQLSRVRVGGADLFADPVRLVRHENDVPSRLAHAFAVK